MQLLCGEVHGLLMMNPVIDADMIQTMLALGSFELLGHLPR